MTHWDKQVAEQLLARGLSWNHAMIAVGIIAEHRQIADREGYKRGFQDGFEFAQKKGKPIREIKTT